MLSTWKHAKNSILRSSASLEHTTEPKHIVDILIEERAVKLRQHPLVWRFVNTVGAKLLGYDRAVFMADAIADLSGRDGMNYLSGLLNLKIEVSGLDYVPKSRPVLITPNHPAGIADGIAVFEVLKHVRKDICFVANRDAIRVSPGMADLIIPVEWRAEERSSRKTKETVRAINQAFKDERLIVIFPSGRLAQPTLRGLKERPWYTTALNFAKKWEADVLPMHVRGHNTLLYYLVWYINDELKDMTLFRELLNKQGQKYRLSIGESFKVGGDVVEQTERLKRFVLDDLKNGITRFG